MENNLANAEISCDVLVCGGGPSGFAAALAASRNGAKTIMAERYGFPGGMMTAGLVNPIYGFFSRHIQVVKGIAQELVDELSQIPGGTLGHTYRADCVSLRKWMGECVTGVDEVHCQVGTVAKVCAVDSEFTKLVMIQMLQQANVYSLYHVWVTGTVLEDGFIRAVVIQGKSGRNLIRPKVVIDATGDADVSAFSGVKVLRGYNDNGISKPPSLMFKISNADLQHDRIRVDLLHPKTGEKSIAWLMALPERGSYTVNAPSGIQDFDSTDTASLSASQEVATREMYKLFVWLKENVKGCQNIKLQAFAPNIGIRDSRRIVGKYVLTEDDVLNARKFPQSGIANAVHPIDLHLKVKEFNHRNIIASRCGDFYQIPFECLVPLGVENLLVAGRSISATFFAQGSLRVMATCMALGQAAGTAAALALRDNKNVGDLDTGELRSTLIKDGAYLGDDPIPDWNMGKAPLPEDIHTRTA